jgi:hypothetical protein
VVVAALTFVVWRFTLGASPKVPEPDYSSLIQRHRQTCPGRLCQPLSFENLWTQRSRRTQI